MNKANYGIDAPKVIKNCILIATFLLLNIGIIFYFFRYTFPLLSWIIITFLFFGLISAVYPILTIMMGSLKFKFRERDWLFSFLKIQGDEQILDVGCGRGLLVIEAAKKLNNGKATGIDIWCTKDQTKNSLDAALENARIENVLNKVEIITADARKMPFRENMFDIVISSWAIHNIATLQEREKALKEIKRVLKPGGTVAIMDIDCFKEYEIFFKANNFTNIELIGPRYTFGNVTYIVKACKE